MVFAALLAILPMGRGAAAYSLTFPAGAYAKPLQLETELNAVLLVKKSLRTAAAKFNNLFNFGYNSQPGYMGGDRWLPLAQDMTEGDTLYSHNMIMLGACSLYYRAMSSYDPKNPGENGTIAAHLKYLNDRKQDARRWAGSMFGGTLPNMGYAAYVNMFAGSECCRAGQYNYANYGFDIGYCTTCEPGFYCLGGSNRFQCPAETPNSPPGSYSVDECY